MFGTVGGVAWMRRLVDGTVVRYLNAREMPEAPAIFSSMYFGIVPDSLSLCSHELVVSLGVCMIAAEHYEAKGGPGPRRAWQKSLESLPRRAGLTGCNKSGHGY